MPPPDHRIAAFLPALLAGAVLWAPARAEDTPQTKLHAVEHEIEESRTRQAVLAKQAHALAAELASLRREAIAAAAAAQQHETALTALEARLVALAAEERAKTAELHRQRAAQSHLLMALERLGSGPPESLLLVPGNPVDVLRGALVMGATVPPLEKRAQALKAQLDALAQLRAEIAATEGQHHTQAQALATEQARIATLIARKETLLQQTAQGVADSGQHLNQLAAQASDLRDLIARLDAEARQRAADRAAKARAAAAPPASAAAHPPGNALTTAMVPPPPPFDPTKPRHIRPFSQARGAVLYPAAGIIVRTYGEPNALGVASKGMSLETRPGAEVVAPFDGQVEFAGPFRGYGHILIIAHGDGYHSLLAGLDRVNCRVGQWLVAGEPVGVMPAGPGKPRLYLELRHNNQPINPLPWLVTRAEKVDG